MTFTVLVNDFTAHKNYVFYIQESATVLERILTWTGLICYKITTYTKNPLTTLNVDENSKSCSKKFHTKFY